MTERVYLPLRAVFYESYYTSDRSICLVMENSSGGVTWEFLRFKVAMEKIVFVDSDENTVVYEKELRDGLFGGKKSNMRVMEIRLSRNFQMK